jgi:hypothetical protein
MMRLLIAAPAVLALLSCSGQPTCPEGDLECLFGSMTWSDMADSSSSEFADPPQTLFPLQLEAMERHASPTPPQGGLRLQSGASSFEMEEPDDSALVLLSWTDPNGCRPSFCMSACPKGVRCVGARCSPTLRDGLRSGTTLHWVKYEKAPVTTTDFDMQLVAASAPGCPENVAPLIEADDPGVLYSEAVKIAVRIAGKNDEKPGGSGGSVCPGGWVGSTVACIPLGPGGSCQCNGSENTCITRTEYESVTGRPFPAACFPKGTTGCVDTMQGTLVKPCCANLRCVLSSKCGGDATVGGTCQ